MSSEANLQIWQMDRDGSHRQQITHSTGYCADPSASADGTTLVFSQGDCIWRMSIDGVNAEQVTSGSRSIWNSEISPDGKWVTYYSNEGGPAKASLHGENITALDPIGGGYPTISADGHWIAFRHWDEKAQQSLMEKSRPTAGVLRAFCLLCLRRRIRAIDWRNF
jgi:TolB protein